MKGQRLVSRVTDGNVKEQRLVTIACIVTRECERSKTGKQSDRWECGGTKTGNHSMHSDMGM